MIRREAALALLAGTLFGVGLALSGMSDPARVRAFLDVFGAWDPTLLFVMGGALCPMTIAWFVQRRQRRPFFASTFELPEPAHVTPRLVWGAALFGIGWGLAGLCPGPALVDLALEPGRAGTFVAAMAAGMALQCRLFRSGSEGR